MPALGSRAIARREGYPCLVTLRLGAGSRERRANLAQPRPTNGIFVAMMVMNCTLASSGRLAM